MPQAQGNDKQFLTGKRKRRTLLLPVLLGLNFSLFLIAMLMSGGAFQSALVFESLGLINAIMYFAIILLCFSRREIFTGVFLLFLCLPPVQVYFNNYLWEAPLDWHQIYPFTMLLDTLEYMFVFCFFSYTLVLTRAVSRPAAEIRKVLGRSSSSGRLVILTLSVLSSSVLLAIFWTANRNEWIRDASVGDRFIQILATLALGLIVSVGIIYQSRLTRLAALGALGTATFVAASGARAVLVSCVLGYCATMLPQRRIRPVILFAILVAALGAYFLLLYFSYFRSNGISASDVFAGDALARVSFADVIKTAGRHEQTALFTVSEALYRIGHQYGMTYVTAILRMLPNSIYIQVTDLQSASNILAIGAPVQFAEGGLNLGAYFPAEAVLNFGPIGAFFVLSLVLLFAFFLEDRKYESSIWMLWYAIAVMMTPTLAFYGSVNFIKQGAVLLVAAYVIGNLNSRRSRTTSSSLGTIPPRVFPTRR